MLARLLAAVVLIGGLAACDLPPVTSATIPPHVDLFGDSHAVYARQQFDQLAAGRWDVNYQAQFGADIDTWVWDILRAPGPTIVLALGDNDWKMQNQAAGWDWLLSTIPPQRCVVWVEPSNPVAPGWEPTVAANEVTASIVARHPNVRVVDWRDEIAQHPEWFGPDTFHYTDAGYEAYAEALVDAVARC